MNQDDELPGYSGITRKKLSEKKIKVWSDIKVEKPDGAFYEGLLLPRASFTAPGYINMRVDTGYNIGVNVEGDGIRITEQGYSKGDYHLPSINVKDNPDLANVSLIGTGGTVASRLDYRTGAVLPAFTPEELFSAVPEIQNFVNLKPRTVFQILSENFKPDWWVKTAEEVAKEIESGIDGVCIGHGTDTMAYSGSALSFFLQNLPCPVVILGSQRSSDRPSSDAAINLINAANFAGYQDVGEVVVSMMGSTSHKYDYVHRPTRVRKMHSSRRDTFRSIGTRPIAKTDFLTKKVTYYESVKKRANPEDFYLDAKIDKRVAMMYFYPGMNPDMLHSLIDLDYHGIVIIGTGLGHVGSNMYDVLQRAKEEEIPIVMVVQPLFGFAHLRVYETGREMLSRGVIEGINLIPEAAYPKLCWVLGKTRNVDEVKTLMQTNIAGEIINRETKNGFLILQGTEPGLDKLLSQI